jgi:hypothetical protein
MFTRSRLWGTIASAGGAAPWSPAPQHHTGEGKKSGSATLHEAHGPIV